MTSPNDATLLLARIAALPFNPYFRADIGKLRRKYNIPVNELDKGSQEFNLGLSKDDYSDEWEDDWEEEEEEIPEGWVFKFVPNPDPGYKWYLEMTAAYKNNSLSFYYKVFWKQGAFFPIDDSAVVGFQVPYWQSPWRRNNKCKMKTLLDTEVPLEIDLIAILRRYGLPLHTFYYTLDYILSGSAFHVSAYNYWFQSVRPLYHKLTGDDELTVCVTLHPWDNKHTWDSCWSPVSRFLKNLRILRGITEPSTKRSSVWSYWWQIVRFAQWYQLSEIQGLGPTEALKQWEKDHPEQGGKFDLSTVTKGLSTFRRVIAPVKNSV